jgi:hypothetical protein
LLDEGISIRIDAFGNDHPRVAVGRVAKANLLIATGRYEDALELAKLAKTSLLEALPEEHWLVAYASSAEGGALTRLGSYPEAEQLLLSSLKALEPAPITGVVEQHRARLVELYVKWDRNNEAEKYR